jgi:LCP family protein required for cell wall assembly
MALGLAVLVGAAGSAGVLYSARERSEEVERVPDLEEVLAANDGPAENFLLVGSDSREGVDTGDPENASIGDEAEVSGQRSDTIMILRREEEGGASLLSLPRDLWVPIAGTDHSAKINSAYNEGPQRLARTVTESLGIPIHHYVEIDFQGFTSLVDEIGGVEICIGEYPAQDENTGLRLNPGCQVLDGTMALAYARSRHYQQFIDGEWREDPRAPDLGRIARQQEFIRTAVTKLLRQIRRQPFRLGELIGAATGAVRIDEDVDPVDAANALRGAAEEGLATYTLPVEGVEHEGQAALELADGAEPILNYFRGLAPQPPPTTTTVPD